MKVLAVHSFGQINERLKNETDTLIQNGYDVDLLLWKRGDLEQDQWTEEQKEQLNIDYIDLKAPFGSLKILLYLPLLYVKTVTYILSRDHDIPHCTHLMLLPLTVLVGMVSTKKTVYAAHEYYWLAVHAYVPESVNHVIREEHIETIENGLVRFSDGVVTVDSAENRALSRYLDHNENSTATYNVPTLDDLPPKDMSVEISSEYLDTNLVVYVGGIAESKGVLDVIRAASEVDVERYNCKFLFIGTFRDDSEGKAMDLIEELGLQESVEFKSWMPYREMQEYLSVSQVGLIPFRPIARYRILGEGNTRKLFTYLSSGIPVVSADFLELTSLIEEYQFGLATDTSDPAAFVATIEDLLDDEEKAKAMGRRGRKAIEKEFNWDHEQSKLLAVYDNL